MYHANHPFKYALEYALVLPDDAIYFKPETPEDIKARFAKDWAEYCEKRKKEQQEGFYYN